MESESKYVRGLAQHPRLFGSDLSHVRNLILDDDRSRGWYRNVEHQAERLLSTPASAYRIPDGKRLLDTSREVLRRTYLLALAHHVSHRKEFADRLWLELLAASRFPDWNPSHFLDVAEMAHAFAIGYDWLHEEWDATQREHLEHAIVTHALRPGLQAYSEGHRWAVRTSNWNLVCNAGLLMAALAIADVHRDLAEKVIGHAMASMAGAVAVYGPDGAYPEGLGYWSYGTQYLVLGLAAFTTATDMPEQLSSVPGLDRTARFAVHVTGPLGLAFNYYDGVARITVPPAGFWLARRFDDGLAAGLAAQGADELLTDWDQLPTSLLWYRPMSEVDPESAGEPRDACFRASEVVTMRSAWHQRTALWLAGKAGDNATTHSDLDLGSFVLDALGTRWLHDLGWDNYSLPGYFDFAGGQRWTYYRKRTEGHNTLVANPDATGGQSCSTTLGEAAGMGVGTVIAHQSTASEAYAVLDLTSADPAYRSWKRGWRLFDFRRQVLLQDEVTLHEPGEVWSFLHTSAQIDIADDGRGAVLRDGPKRLVMRLSDQTPGRLVEMEAAPLWTSPAPRGQSTNAAIRKLALRVSVEGPVTLAIQLTPVADHEPVPPPTSVLPLANWTVSTESVAQLERLAIDGEGVPGFSPEVWSYEIPASQIGRIQATASAGSTVDQIREPGGDVVLEVHAPGARTGSYRLRRLLDDSPTAMTSPIFASSDDGNVAANAFDGMADSFWRPGTAGPEWIGCDLGVEAEMGAVLIAWREGARASVRFDVELAGADGTWWQVWTGSSSGTTTAAQRVSWPPRKARYVRIVRRDDGAASLFAVTSIELPERLPRQPSQLQSADIHLVVPALRAGSAEQASVSLRSPLGGVVPSSDYTFELISSESSVLEIAGDRMAPISPGTVVVTAVVRTKERLLLHHSVRVQVQPPQPT
ncbi:discoidin domain-containing protein [Occultella aeris]|uniref:F5/8 type C domain protein n=1 Tax=Occultella aeris TaxID=2761496 RepID=A0A7M4DQQ6_9MICO|nr:discoidin domain-containing protein [Occultella aeris]VZO39800.1 F5/8 type C domain protein [Occultella aeris]